MFGIIALIFAFSGQCCCRYINLSCIYSLSTNRCCRRHFCAYFWTLKFNIKFYYLIGQKLLLNKKNNFVAAFLHKLIGCEIYKLSSLRSFKKDRPYGYVFHGVSQLRSFSRSRLTVTSNEFCKTGEYFAVEIIAFLQRIFELRFI